MRTKAEKTVGLVGARGYVGAELLALIGRHSRLQLAFASSRTLVGQTVAGADLEYEALTPGEVRERAPDIVILALPNGLAHEYVDALDGENCILIDVSADHRFDSSWAYGLPELYDIARGTLRISNPGCYATAMQLAIAPVVDMLRGSAVCFGVSGYSGAGTSPSERNDPQHLKNNLIPYAGIGHLHEREVALHLGHPVNFMPHVASFFRGISMTVDMSLAEPWSLAEIIDIYTAAYADKALVRLSETVPLVADNAHHHHATVGGWQLSADGHRLVVYATLDNLLKGAATQALQNLNLACGFAELEGTGDDFISLARRNA
jgi:N-acetyl-gamma-glutamyl-phosphate reductase common form